MSKSNTKIKSMYAVNIEFHFDKIGLNFWTVIKYIFWGNDIFFTFKFKKFKLAIPFCKLILLLNIIIWFIFWRLK